MGQYYRIVNVDKREFIRPNWQKLLEFGSGSYSEMMGLSLLIMQKEDKKQYLEQISNLKVGGLLDLNQYVKTNTGARNVISRWAGDKIVIAGDYAEEGEKGEGTLKPHVYKGEETFTTLYDACCGYHAKGEGLKDITDIVTKALYGHPYVFAVNVYDALCGYDFSGDTKTMLKNFMPESAIKHIYDIASRVGKLDNEEREGAIEGLIDKSFLTNHKDIAIGNTAAYLNLDKGQYVKANAFGDTGNLSGSILTSGFTQALTALLPNSNNRGGGDLRSDNAIIGSWAGDRVVYVADYIDVFLEDQHDISEYVLTALFDDEYVKNEYIEKGVLLKNDSAKELTTA